MITEWTEIIFLHKLNEKRKRKKWIEQGKERGPYSSLRNVHIKFILYVNTFQKEDKFQNYSQ